MPLLLPLLLAVLAVLGGSAVAFAAECWRRGPRPARRATSYSPARTRPGWGEGSRIPEGAFSIHDYEN